MKYKAVLAQTSRDYVKSRILSENVSQVVLDVYMSSSQFGKLVSDYMGKEIEIQFSEVKDKEFEL